MEQAHGRLSTPSEVTPPRCMVLVVSLAFWNLEAPSLDCETVCLGCLATSGTASYT